MWLITSDLKQRQEEDAFAVNQKQGRHGGTGVAGFQSIQRERLFVKHAAQIPRGDKYIYFECSSRVIPFFWFVFLPGGGGYVTAGVPVCLTFRKITRESGTDLKKKKKKSGNVDGPRNRKNKFW